MGPTQRQLVPTLLAAHNSLTEATQYDRTFTALSNRRPTNNGPKIAVSKPTKPFSIPRPARGLFPGNGRVVDLVRVASTLFGLTSRSSNGLPSGLKKGVRAQRMKQQAGALAWLGQSGTVSLPN